MFGLLKENVLDKLENLHNSNKPVKMKKEFARFMKTLKEDKMALIIKYNAINAKIKLIEEEMAEIKFLLREIAQGGR